MTARSDINKAHALSDELDRVTQALAIVAAGGFTQSLEISTADRSGVRVTISVSASNLTTMLTNRQTAINSALTALGIT